MPLDALRQGLADSGASSVPERVRAASPLLARLLGAPRLSLLLLGAGDVLRAATEDSAAALAWPGARVTRRALALDRGGAVQLQLVRVPAPDEPPGLADALLDELAVLLGQRWPTPGPSAPPAPDVVGAGQRIAVVDDHAALARATGRLVQSLGYAATSFSSAHAVLAAFAQDPRAFELVLTDQSMPDLTGVELAVALRARGVEVPVLVVTGLVSSLDVSAVTPPVRVLGKPYRGDELIDALQSLLAR